jgi:hypothetical protein
MPVKKFTYISGPRMGTSYHMNGVSAVTGIPKKTALPKKKKKKKLK